MKVIILTYCIHKNVFYDHSKNKNFYKLNYLQTVNIHSTTNSWYRFLAESYILR